MALLNNYILPLIGQESIQSITPLFVDKFYSQLKKTPPVSCKTRPAQSEHISEITISKVHKLLSCAFNRAVKWELIPKNPFANSLLDKPDYNKREIWSVEDICKALDVCRDDRLYLAMNLSFACSLRSGEALALTWNNVHISEREIAQDNAYIYVDKELSRISKDVMSRIDNKGIQFVFPTLYPNTSTRLVFADPKTESSIRKIWLPKTLAHILLEWKKSQRHLKELLGDEYTDYDLVIAQYNGRPVENRILHKAFENLRKEAGLPDVVFHSLRHASATVKLKLNHGDTKSTQGDTGHATTNMVTQVYAHIVDEDRKVNAQRFEAAIYANPDLRKVQVPQENKTAMDAQNLLAQLQANPELLSALSGLLNTTPN